MWSLLTLALFWHGVHMSTSTVDYQTSSKRLEIVITVSAEHLEEILRRKPISTVFDAFVEPAITSKFWFSRGSAPLKPGAKVIWNWDMYGFKAEVDVIDVTPHTRIEITWPNPVEWVFTPYGDNATMVVITTSCFEGTHDQAVVQAIDNMGGFSFLLAGAKAWLEHGIQLNLVPDHSPAPDAVS